MIVLDANILIAYLSADDEHHDRVVDFLVDHAGDTFCASALTVAESLVHPARHGRVDAAASSLSQLGVAEFALDAGRGRGLAEVRASTRLRLPDAVVVQLAETLACPLATLDVAVMRAAAERGVATADV